MKRFGMGVLLYCILLANTADARSRSSHGCLRQGERVVVRLRADVIVRRTQRERAQPRYGEHSETRWWVCVPGLPRRYLGRTLAHPSATGEEGETYDGFRSAGEFLVFRQLSSSNYGNETERVLEADLRTGRRTLIWAAEGEPLSISHVLTINEYHASVGAPLLAIDSQGEVAWAIRDQRGIRMVLVHNGLGTKVLASYPRSESEPAITDLVISMGRVSWSYSGTTVTASA